MKEHVRKIVLAGSVILCLGGVAYLVSDHMNQDQNSDVYEQVQEQVQVLEPTVKEETPVEVSIDFTSLKKINKDIYAWIDIEDTNVHYPIVQSPTDDSYYLEHTIEGVKGYPGSIYTERVNAKDFSDFNTVIYGHDMKDGSMFKHLHKFEDPEFFETHDTVTIYTEKEIKTYRIYAAIVFDNRHLMYHFNNDDIEDRKAFIQAINGARNMKNLYREGMTIDENSKLITMSTCITGQPDKRYLVVAEEIAK